MTVSPSDLLQRIDQAIAHAQSEIVSSRERANQQATHLEQLAEEKTDAFVELANHYLPELSQQSLSVTWSEVKREIRDILLRKDRQRRGLIAQQTSCQAAIDDLIIQLGAAKQERDQAKTVLDCKAGNVRKLLGEDPDVVFCMREIERLDKEIERNLQQLESVKEDARNKLPDYEESSLFQYLLERHYGTPSYDATGYERRWDRWVARLIDFTENKRSYDYLTQTPKQLKRLIDKKQSTYRELLTRLRAARRKAIQLHGTRKQKAEWKSACDQVDRTAAKLQAKREEFANCETRLHELDSLNGAFHQEAIQVYCRFLASLEPEVLRIYAECTPSPEDDEICSSIRDMQNDIDTAEEIAKNRFIGIVKHEKLVSALRELSVRLKRHLLSTLGELQLVESFRFDDLLDEMKARQLAPAHAWRRLCDAMVELPKTKTDELRPLDAWFTAASEFSRREPSDDDMDLSAVMLRTRKHAPIPSPNESFVVLARCPSSVEAKFLERKLRSESVPCFAHTHLRADERLDLPPRVDLMVAATFYKEGRKLVERLRWEHEQSWSCDFCGTQVDEGFTKCWRCGHHRPFSI